MFLKRNQLFIALAAAILPLTGCTLDEPSESAGSGDGRLESVSQLGMTAMKIEYDAQNRPVKILMPIHEEVWEFSYKPLNITYDEYNGKELSEHNEMTNIILDNGGRIVSFDNHTTYYQYSYEWDDKTETTTPVPDGKYEETTRNVLSYDSEGHLLSITTDSDVTYFHWKGGLLESITESDDTYGQAAVEYTYGNTDNKNGQWSIFWTNVSPLQVLGYMGTAPSRFPCEISGGYEGSSQFAYSLNKYGYIASEKVLEDGEYIVFTYNYR